MSAGFWNAASFACGPYAVENALTLAAARRLARPADAPPLAIIRSLAYFSPVIEEVLRLQVGPEYFHHLRNRIVSFTPAR